MKINKRKIAEIFGVIIFTFGALIFIGLLSTSSTGKFGKVVQFIYSMSFGNTISFIIPFYLFAAGFLIFKEKPIFLQLKSFLVFLIFGMISSSTVGLFKFGENSKFFVERINDHGDLLGSMGFYSSRFLNKMFGLVGSYIFLSGITLILLMYIFDFRIMKMLKVLSSPFKISFNFIVNGYHNIRKNMIKKKLEKEMKEKQVEIQNVVDESTGDSEESFDEKRIETMTEPTDLEEQESDLEKSHSLDREKVKDIKIEEAIIEKEVDFKNKKTKEYKYETPSIDLLNESKVKINIIENEEKLRENAATLISKLQEFSLEAEVVQINPGPVLTQYEIKLASGVKVAKVSSLEKDLAMALSAKSIRIVAPIPGKNTVGIEIPNSNPSIVYLKSIINSEKFINHKSKLAIALGKRISGENYILDLAKTPHLLIAGSTGSGKSVCINGLIMSILYRATPEEVQFCMIDPKRVELSIYSSLLQHHLLRIDGIDDPVVTNPEDAVRLLEALVQEMESRYQILQQSGTRNLQEYNNLVESGDIQMNKISNEPFKKMPYIVCIMDEYGDLMMTSGKAVEDPICRLAQMARAIGIHMVLATQRPSVKVVTGAIKANFPTRIAFRVMSQIDSRTILDTKGAESLLGKGDMLIVPPGESDLVRIQNALVETNETNKVVKHIAHQPTDFDKISIKANPSAAQIALEGGIVGGDRGGSDDEKYEDAKRMVVTSGMASVSMLQRGLSVGYARAGKLIDQLERNGVIGPHQGSKPRSVLINTLDD
ncbi:MAG: DNA translocase FtsK [Candidatus Delongbacteria bacterium]|jgi:S-DNA-T family DNA segregation ATPase FtsK/SpoIIIE|nr:DNA translocase FtsK [Candidatus Delongbacteria bacterium]